MCIPFVLSSSLLKKCLFTSHSLCSSTFDMTQKKNVCQSDCTHFKFSSQQMTSKDRRLENQAREKLGCNFVPVIDEKSGKEIGANLSAALTAVPWYYGTGTTIEHQKIVRDSKAAIAGEQAVRAALSQGVAVTGGPAAVKAISGLKIKTASTTTTTTISSSSDNNKPNVLPQQQQQQSGKSDTAEKKHDDDDDESSPVSIGNKDLSLQSDKKTAVRRDRQDDDGEDPLLAMLLDETLGSSSSSALTKAAPDASRFGAKTALKSRR